jgi:hypothetical protein
MSDNKPKIDLKSRLGKKTVATKGGPSIPPPVGIPRPALPGGGPGIKVDASDPYAAISADSMPAKRKEPQAIRVEMSHEVIEAQKKGRALVIALAAITAVVGAGLGYTIGGRVESNKGAQRAVGDAAGLAKEVDAANATANQLAETLNTIQSSLKDNKYPEGEGKKLGALNIDFTGVKLAARNIGRFQPNTVKMLIGYAGGAQEANDEKEKLQNKLSAYKTTVTDQLEQLNKTTTKVRLLAGVDSGPRGPMVWFQPLEKEHWFLIDKKDDKAFKWPEKFKVKEGKDTKERDRYTKGDPSGGKLIPVDPDTFGQVCPLTIIGQLMSDVNKVEELLKGDKTPGQEKTGLIDTGDALIQELKKIGKP